jgi:NAD(P)H-dependent flavin oxidoreductase YrpB (nitropropane dioxygenase family)
MSKNTNRITELFGIRYPLIQAGMIWCSGWELASAVSNAGGLGIIGSGSMYPDVLDEQIQKCKQATKNPFAVNLPMLYPDIDKHIETIFLTGEPKYTSVASTIVRDILRNGGDASPFLPDVVNKSLNR